MNTIELDPSKDWGMLAYTDGGARPNPGSSGCGMHGYFYEIQNPPPAIKPIKFSDGEVVKYAFPSETGYVYCSKDGVVAPGAAKTAVPVTQHQIFEVAESSSNQHTNNYAEMKSFLNAIRLARLHKVKQVFIITDSDYTLKGVTQWCKGWETNGWMTRQGEVVKNVELWMVLYQEYKSAQEDGIKVSGAWIKGHKGHPGNVHADDMATIGVIKSSKGIDDSEVFYFKPKDFWEPKKKRHPLLSLKRMYFNRERERNVPGTYYMADPGKEDHLVGKPLSEAVYAVVRMKEPDPIIDAVLEAQFRYSQDFNITMMMKLETIFESEATRLISTHGSMCMLKGLRGTAVELPNGRAMTIEKTPIGITMRAIDSINSLETILDQYLALQEGSGVDGENLNSNDMNIFDITEELYDLGEDKEVNGETLTMRILKKEHGVGMKALGITKTVKLPIGDRTIMFPLRMGADLPDRNSLKQLETSFPTVQLITWRDSTLSLRYATVLSCLEGTAIWSNFYADRLILKA